LNADSLPTTGFKKAYDAKLAISDPLVATTAAALIVKT
jgi:hypothetical protein